MFSRIRIAAGNSSLVCYPEAGGMWTYLMQYALGLTDLGHDLLWLETYRKCGSERRDAELIGIFLSRFAEYGLGERVALLTFDRGEKNVDLNTAEIYGKTRAAVEEFISSADLLWNFASALSPPLLLRFKRRVLVDGDPGHWHLSALQYEMGQSQHDVFLTVGSKVHDADCQIPTLGRKWHGYPPCVYLPMWTVAPDPGERAPFTSVTQWNWGEVWWDQRPLSIAKRDAYLRVAELPQRTKRPFELAANIDPDDPTPDRDLLQRHGWSLVHAHKVAGTGALYANYIQRSRAEICCPKPIFRELRTGWFSDRSACYLASGRPVLAEDTGFGDRYPLGDGVLTFRDLDGAIAGVREIDARYEHHSRAARQFAEAYFDSRKCLPLMLSAGGL